MSLIDDTVVVTKELAEMVAQKTAKTVEIQKRRLAVLKIKNQLSRQYEALGKAYYRGEKGDSDNKEGLLDMIQQIDDTKARLVALKKELESMQKSVQ